MEEALQFLFLLEMYIFIAVLVNTNYSVRHCLDFNTACIAGSICNHCLNVCNYNLFFCTKCVTWTCSAEIVCTALHISPFWLSDLVSIPKHEQVWFWCLLVQYKPCFMSNSNQTFRFKSSGYDTICKELLKDYWCFKGACRLLF